MWFIPTGHKLYHTAVYLTMLCYELVEIMKWFFDTSPSYDSKGLQKTDLTRKGGNRGIQFFPAIFAVSFPALTACWLSTIIRG